MVLLCLKMKSDIWPMKSNQATSKAVKIWLWVGLVMIFIQILLGGITRLTGSGLSITKWDIVTGMMYPLSEESWQQEFDLYKATPQFQKINADFKLQDFKFIYFWEYFHRLWARLMGFVFIIPFSYFLIRRQIDKLLGRRLIILVLLAALVASLGWIMVASGLVNRPWVNAYKLSFHLSLAVLTLLYLADILFSVTPQKDFITVSQSTMKWFGLLVILCFVQIFMGGIMAGMKASIVAPTWPKINQDWIPSQVFNGSLYSDYVFDTYEQSHVGPIIIQFWHRLTAYAIFLLTLVLTVQWMRINKQSVKFWAFMLVALVFLQLLLGIFTLLYSVGAVPLWFAVTHQLTGIVFMLCLFYVHRYKLKPIHP